MTEVTVTDGDGATYIVLEHQGYRFPKFRNLAERMDKLHDFEVRDDDVLIVSYPKSGTHWCFGVVTVLLNDEDTDAEINSSSGFIDAMDLEGMKTAKSPRIFFTHFPPCLLAPGFFIKNIKIIHIVRNPKDTLVSYYNQTSKMEKLYDYHGSFKAWLDMNTTGKSDYGAWWDFVRLWEKFALEHSHHQIYTVYYEDLKEDLRGGAQKLAEFLGKSCSEKTLDNVMERCTFSTMKKDHDDKVPEGFKALWKDKQNEMYRKGEVADWKNWFTVAQNEQFDVLCEEKMKGSNLKIRYTI